MRETIRKKMKIPMHHSLKVAHKVVRLINLPKKICDSVTYESWSNCREQGLCIFITLGQICNWKKICVAENRNSDDIVVNFGKSEKFDIQSNQPSEEVWRNRKYFKYKDFEGAAKFIRQEIMEFVKEEEKRIKEYKKKEIEKWNLQKKKRNYEKNIRN